MSKRDKDYDNILTRMVNILWMLSIDERPTKSELAREFNVSERTIDRDFSRLHRFDIAKDNLKRYYFENELGILQKRFSNDEMVTLLLGMYMVQDAGSLFHESAKSVLEKSLPSQLESAYYIKPQCFEYIDTDSDIIQILEDSVLYCKAVLILINYNKKIVEPYKVLALNGLWYLVAFERNTKEIKLYRLANIQMAELLDSNFEVPEDIDEILEDVESEFFDDDRQFNVQIKVNSNIADYFRLRKHLHSQEILEVYEDGSLLIEYEVTHHEDIDNIIKAWLPDIEIVAPLDYREKVMNELEVYINRHR